MEPRRYFLRARNAADILPVGSRLRRGPISFKKWGKEDQGVPLDPVEVGETCWACGFVLPGLRPWCRYAVRGAPTGWARGNVGDTPRVSAG